MQVKSVYGETFNSFCSVRKNSFNVSTIYGSFFIYNFIKCVLHTPDLTPPDMTGYTLDSTAVAWPQEMFTLPRHLFSHLFPALS